MTCTPAAQTPSAKARTHPGRADPEPEPVLTVAPHAWGTETRVSCSCLRLGTLLDRGDPEAVAFVAWSHLTTAHPDLDAIDVRDTTFGGLRRVEADAGPEVLLQMTAGAVR